MLKRIKNKRAEGYIDTCISVVIIMGIIAVAVNLFGFIKLKVELDQIADNLITVATYTGEFGDEFLDCDSMMLEDYFYYDVETGAKEYFGAYEKVQLGGKMWVIVSADTTIKGLGVFEIPVTISVKRSGISERYWKEET